MIDNSIELKRLRHDFKMIHIYHYKVLHIMNKRLQISSQKLNDFYMAENIFIILAKGNNLFQPLNNAANWVLYQYIIF